MSEDTIAELVKTIDHLKQEIIALKQRRIDQMDYLPGSVKNRAMGEGNTYIYGGLAANRPTTGRTIKAGTTIISISAYFETDTNKLYCWNGTSWKSVTLS